MTNLRLQKRLAAKVAGVGLSRIRIDASAEGLKEAITGADISGLIQEGTIKITSPKGISRHRARVRHIQRKKGRQRGFGSRRGTANARSPHKTEWVNKIRAIRKLLNELKDKESLTSKVYRELRQKAKGNFFRSRKHVMVYLEQRGLIKKGDK